MKKDIFTIDSHTDGEPTRVIVGGIVNVPAATSRKNESTSRNIMIMFAKR